MSKLIKISKFGKKLPKNAVEWAGVLDEKTNLMWEYYYKFKFYTFEDAKNKAVEANSLELCKKVGWRLPTITELESLVLKNKKPNCINGRIDSNYFGWVSDSNFWSSTEADENKCLCLNFKDGSIEKVDKKLMTRVRLVSALT